MLARDSLHNKVCLDYPPLECSHKYYGWPCYIMYYRSNFQPYFYNEDEAKRRQSCGPYFQIPNYLSSHKNVQNSIEICSHGSIWHIISFASGNGLATTRRQALVWTNCDPNSLTYIWVNPNQKKLLCKSMSFDFSSRKLRIFKNSLQGSWVSPCRLKSLAYQLHIQKFVKCG